ncbi:MAG TPA: SDR family NAD(P)-dependent oxidoreductase [Actinomycetota bacterium]|jgi:NAD(P)-dependent dehydrogenase (short-subunit alcohol dehydrogenase family)|nr:SDR family NAD(P)-dependent oxidoreductase [Actinomycetota bacterium]
MGRFNDQVVFITGAAQGHGRAHALAFAQEGAHVALFEVTGRSESAPGGQPPGPQELKLEAIRREVEVTGRRCLVIHADSQDTAQLDAAIDRTVRELGRLDVVVARAGVFSLVPVTRSDRLHAENSGVVGPGCGDRVRRGPTGTRGWRAMSGPG